MESDRERQRETERWRQRDRETEREHHDARGGKLTHTQPKSIKASFLI